MANPKAEGTAFDVHLTGIVSGKTWDGTFRAKPTLTFRDRMSADRFRRELVGGSGISTDGETNATATIIAELGVRLVDSPEWWAASKGGLDLVDPNILSAVYSGAKKIEEDYFEKLEADGKAAQEKLKELNGTK